MKIIAVDDENLALRGLSNAIREAKPEAELQCFEYPFDALAHVQAHGCDVAFLDVEMAEMNGVELARCLKVLNPRINIIFTTGFTRYREDAFEMYASGYVTKPIVASRIKAELENLRYDIVTQKRLRVHTFGNFEVSLDGRPLSFKYNKTKELFAYLVNRKGALCTNGEIIAALFEDDENHDIYLRSLRKDLIDTLDKLGCNNLIVQQRGKVGVIPGNFDCDYYDFLDGKHSDIVWQGEYMAQYSWAEYTTATLDSMVNKEK